METIDIEIIREDEKKFILKDSKEKSFSLDSRQGILGILPDYLESYQDKKIHIYLHGDTNSLFADSLNTINEIHNNNACYYHLLRKEIKKSAKQVKEIFK